MYLPPAFAQTDPDKLAHLIGQFPLAVVCCPTSDELIVEHVPLILDRSRAGDWHLLGHVARENRLAAAGGQQVTAVFSGPQAYISPAWYETPVAVPTWNYVSVQARGRLETLDNSADFLDLLAAQVDQFEGGSPGWEIRSAGELVPRLLPAIVGFHIRVAQIHGKWKLSQNHPAARRQRIMAALRADGDPKNVEVADWMEAVRP